jgi:3-oxoadipate CoA-transferase beta subunit
MTTKIRDSIARRAAADLPEGVYVNLGVGIATSVADHIPPTKEIIFHSENGLLGMGPAAAGRAIDPDLINATKMPVSMLKGGAFMHHNDAFAMIRGGHIDYSLMGAFQVSAVGDLANWMIEGDKMPAIGGAMDLAVGAKNVWILMEHCTKRGEPKIVDKCTYPLTAGGVVKRIYTELAILDVTPEGLVLRELMPGVEFDKLQAQTNAPISKR